MPRVNGIRFCKNFGKTPLSTLLFLMLLVSLLIFTSALFLLSYFEKSWQESSKLKNIELIWDETNLNPGYTYVIKYSYYSDNKVFESSYDPFFNKRIFINREKAENYVSAIRKKGKVYNCKFYPSLSSLNKKFKRKNCKSITPFLLSTFVASLAMLFYYVSELKYIKIQKILKGTQ